MIKPTMIKERIVSREHVLKKCTTEILLTKEIP